MFEKYISEYGTRGGQMLIQRVIVDWLELEINVKLDPTDPIRMAANEVIDRVLPALTAAIEEKIGYVARQDDSEVYRG